MTVTPEDIQKAKEILNLVKAEGQDKDKDADLKKGEQIDTLKAEYKDYLSKAKEYMEKAEAAKAALVSMGVTDGDDSEILSHKKSEDLDLNKGEKTTKDTATEDKENKSDNIIKAFDEKFNALTTIITAKEEENVELKKALSDLTEKVDVLSKSSTGPRSITTKSVIDRFAKSEEGTKELSIRGNRRELTAELVKAARVGEKDQDEIFAKAASTMEIAGVPGSSEAEIRMIAQRLKEKHKIVLTA